MTTISDPSSEAPCRENEGDLVSCLTELAQSIQDLKDEALLGEMFSDLADVQLGEEPYAFAQWHYLKVISELELAFYSAKLALMSAMSVRETLQNSGS